MLFNVNLLNIELQTTKNLYREFLITMVRFNIDTLPNYTFKVYLQCQNKLPYLNYKIYCVKYNL